MTRALTKSELLSRYVAEVQRTIGPGAPKDVGPELESLLAESIEAREAATSRELSVEEVAAVLEEFGAPRAVADRYAPRPKYLIGPGLYPIFLVVMKAILLAAALVPLVVVVVSRLATGAELPSVSRGILNWLGMSYQIALGGLAWAVLVFAILERLGVQETVAEPGEGGAPPWKALDLPPVDDPSRASRVGAGFRIYFIVVFLAAFNLFPQWVGLHVFKAGEQPQILSLDDLGIHLPMWQLNLWWALALVQNLLLFRVGRWTPATRWLEFGLGLFGAAIIYPLIGSVGDAMRREPFTTVVGNPRVAAQLARLAPMVLTMILLVVVCSSAYRLYRLLWVGRPGTNGGTTGPLIT